MDKKGIINYDVTKHVKDHARVLSINTSNEE